MKMAWKCQKFALNLPVILLSGTRSWNENSNTDWPCPPFSRSSLSVSVQSPFRPPTDPRPVLTRLRPVAPSPDRPVSYPVPVAVTSCTFRVTPSYNVADINFWLSEDAAETLLRLLEQEDVVQDDGGNVFPHVVPAPGGSWDVIIEGVDVARTTKTLDEALLLMGICTYVFNTRSHGRSQRLWYGFCTPKYLR